MVKQKKLLGEDILIKSDYSFSENGLFAYKDEILINKTTIKDYIGETNIKRFINWCLIYIGELDIPIK